MMLTKQDIEEFIQQFVQAYEARPTIAAHWGTPLVGFADAHHPDIHKLKPLISPRHVMPKDIVADASIIIAYFVPFTKEMVQTNAQAGSLSSPEWARTHEETNALFRDMNEALIAYVKGQGYHAGIGVESTTFDREKLISYWSQRHIARLAGLGTFGINNMLITKAGCCGRYSTVVTNLAVTPDAPLTKELCLYKSKGLCGVCVKHCTSGALPLSGYDRKKCFHVCQENAKIYLDFGSSYANEDGTGSNSVGSEVCGKCVVNVPCSFWRR